MKKWDIILGWTVQESNHWNVYGFKEKKIALRLTTLKYYLNFKDLTYIYVLVYLDKRLYAIESWLTRRTSNCFMSK